MRAATRSVISAAMLTGAVVSAASVSYAGASAFLDKTFVVTFDLGPNYQLITGRSNVEFRFHVSSDGAVFFSSPSTEKLGCSRSSGSIPRVNQGATTASHLCEGISDTTTSRVTIVADILTYTETRSVTSSASKNKLAINRSYAFGFSFDGHDCEALRYIVEGTVMSPVSCRVEDGDAAG